MAEYIERDALIRHFKNSIDEVKNTNGYTNGFEICLRALQNQPIADVKKVKHGQNITEMNPVDEFICSECKICFRDTSPYDTENDVYQEFYFNYCPKCGAKIDIISN